MFNNGSMTNRAPRPDQHQYADLVPGYAGFETARLLRTMALAGIAARLFYIYASANRISITHTLLGLIGPDGRLDPTNQPDALALAAHARDADGLVTFALVVSVVAMVLFLLTWFALSRRKKRGDTLAAAVDRNRGVLIAGRMYAVLAIANVALRNAFTPSATASPTDRLHAVANADTANICFQIGVIVFLLIVALATGREMTRAVEAPADQPAVR
jgi:hypothetical protein